MRKTWKTNRLPTKLKSFVEFVWLSVLLGVVVRLRMRSQGACTMTCHMDQRVLKKRRSINVIIQFSLLLWISMKWMKKNLFDLVVFNWTLQIELFWYRSRMDLNQFHNKNNLKIRRFIQRAIPYIWCNTKEEILIFSPFYLA